MMMYKEKILILAVAFVIRIATHFATPIEIMSLIRYGAETSKNAGINSILASSIY